MPQPRVDLSWSGSHDEPRQSREVGPWNRNTQPVGDARNSDLRRVDERAGAPMAYMDVSRVVEVGHSLGISKKVARLEPLAVIKG